MFSLSHAHDVMITFFISSLSLKFTIILYLLQTSDLHKIVTSSLDLFSLSRVWLKVIAVASAS